MQTLPLLIRLAKQKIDAGRAALVQAEREHQAATAQLTAQAALLRQETLRAAGDPVEMAAWTAWSRRMARQAEPLRQAQAQAARREAGLRDELAQDFAEIKRLELAWETRQRDLLKLASRRAEKRAEEAALRRGRGA